MRKIRLHQVRMKSPFVFLAEKLGLESALVAALLLGAFLVSVTLYFFKRTGVLKFLNLGFPGLKVVLLTIPYDYLALILLAIILSVYFARRLDIPCEHNLSCNRIGLYFFLAAFFMGVIFVWAGVHELAKGFEYHSVPRDTAISGKVKNVSENEIVIEDEPGHLASIVIGKKTEINKDLSGSKGKVIRVIGDGNGREKTSEFKAELIWCCDED